MAKLKADNDVGKALKTRIEENEIELSEIDAKVAQKEARFKEIVEQRNNQLRAIKDDIKSLNDRKIYLSKKIEEDKEVIA